MAITLAPEARKQALASVRRYCNEQLDMELEAGDLQMALLLDFFLKEIGPALYNAGVSDAQAFLRDRLVDLEATCYEPEFVYWPKATSVRRK
jgi:uncharacterized protein (DUF2164 family)